MKDPGFCILKGTSYEDAFSQHGEATRRPIQAPVNQQNLFSYSRLITEQNTGSPPNLLRQLETQLELELVLNYMTQRPIPRVGVCARA